MDGDKEYYRIKTVLEQERELEKVDLLKLIFLPLMKSQEDEAEMTIKAAELAKSTNSEFTTFVIGAIIAITDKFLPEDYKKRLLEVLRMTQIEEWLREEGKLEGKLEGEMKDARNALNEGIEPTIVAKITGLPLETILKIKVDQAN